ncbi:MAG: 50S ribosomal protein L9 [Bacteroidia bacterium]
MEVILKQLVKNLGDQDDVVKVKPGYARNYLIPQGLAMMATESSKRALEEKKRQAAHKQEFVLNNAQELAEKIGALEIKIVTLAGQDGKLFGSVTSLQVSNKLKEHGIEISHRRIDIESIREVGSYVAEVSLHKSVVAKINIEVVGQEKPGTEA